MILYFRVWFSRAGVGRRPTKVALVQCPVWWTTDPPLGLAQLAGALKAAGHDVDVFDLSIELFRVRGPAYENAWAWEQFAFWQDPAWTAACFRDHASFWDAAVARIARSDAAVVGFAAFLGSLRSTLEVARRVKEAAPDKKIVLGGEYFFFGDKAAEVLAEPCVDAVVTRAADFTLPDLVASLVETGRLQPCPGALVKVDGAPVWGGERPEETRLDSLPFADYTAFPLDLYDDENRIPMAASRGCIRRCAFCSTRAFWEGYGYMSGDRIFAEVAHHRKLFPDRRHVEFYDITANGDVPSLERFAERVIESGLDITWKINAVIRPEMTREVLDKMAKSGCISIIYGVESGSEKVLRLMRKGYTPEVADRVLKDTHEAGIKVTGNFMFGFPGETEDDFRQTLDFLRRNHRYLDRVYPSRTFTALEEHASLFEHPEQFGVKIDPDKPTNLYWETEDGTNDFLVRLRRCEAFCRLAVELGCSVEKGLEADLELDRWLSLGGYHEYRGEHDKAVDAYLRYAELDLLNGAVQGKLREYDRRLRAALRGRRVDEAAADRALLKRVRATLAQAALERKAEAPAAAAFTGAR